MNNVDPTLQHILELRDTINRHNHAYYVLNTPTISDYDFDMLLKELEQLEAQNPQYDDPCSPTRRVGSDINTHFEQVKHIYPMLSLSNTYSIAEVDDFLHRVHQSLGSDNIDIVGEMKYDGTSISLIYRNGRLERAVTRGDGEKGDVVTDNIKTIPSIPLQLTGSGWPELFEIRGEVLLPWKAFEKLNAERAFNEEPLFANPRNAASGTLKLLNPAEVARRGLDAYFYYLLGENLPADNHYDNILAARSWGFKTAPIMTLLHSIDQVDAFINHWDTARRELPVATDGLVFKVNSLKQQLNLGFTAKSPRWAIAYKFPAEKALSRLQSISFEVGRTGTITPVANLDPVLLSGTIVKRASLHNADIIKSLDIHDHDMLYVEKGGEIIPKITGVDINAREPDARPVTFITNCPACGSTLVRNEGEAAWLCPNTYGCPPQIIGRIEHFVGRRMMNIDGIGEETAQVLYNNNLVTNIADLYQLTLDKIATLDRFGTRSAERIIQGLKNSLTVPFERVLFALSIPFVGETGAKKLARAAGDIDTLMAMDLEQLTNIDDIGERTALSIIEFFANPDNRLIIERLRAAGLQMAIQRQENETTNLLQGKTIVISGTFTHNSRDRYKELIELNGGKNSGSISKKTDYLLAGENMGPAKLEKATSLGVPIIDEETFLKMITPA